MLYSLSLAAVVMGGVVPTREIEAGVFMPMVGLGTWQYDNDVASAAVTVALNTGYSHIDTALGYGNQKGIGKALATSLRTRESYFITTKIPGGLTYEEATSDLEQNLAELGLDYVDHVMLHFPASWGGVGGKTLRQAQWKALEDFKAAGKTRSIGVSHYCRQHLLDILEINTTAIAINQVEYHIGMGSAGVNATDDKEFCQSLGITYMSFSTLCGPCGTTELINGLLVTDIGKKYNKTGAQVSLKWAVQQGIPVIPKTSNVEYMIQNIDLFSWELSRDDMAALTSTQSPAVSGNDDGLTSGDCSVA